MDFFLDWFFVVKYFLMMSVIFCDVKEGFKDYYEVFGNKLLEKLSKEFLLF